ncbi:MAG: type II secretion system F family protein [Armatimonadetes bacterium]|nr:type II secretion system F family protein [Armatimonadota bacterium]
MPTFTYHARDKTGKQIQETAEAASKDALLEQLRGKGLFVSTVSEKKTAKRAEKKGRGGLVLFQGRVKLRDLSIFYRQFATMINAGVSLIRSLDVLEQQTSSYRLKTLLRDIESEVEGGASLSQAMTKYTRTFSQLAIGLVRAGEVGGVLDETLSRLAIFIEKDMELRRKVKSAMTYPIIVLIFATLIVLLLTTYILPQFIQLFEDLGLKEDAFPLPTLMLMRASEFLTSKWYMALMIIAGLVIVFNRVKATKTGKRIYDGLALKVPVFGGLTHKIAIARFARTLATLMGSGVPILQAMETTAGTITNDLISDAVLAARANIRQGDTIADPLAASKQFPPMVVQMVTIGEETGQLDDMLEKVADFYEAEVDATLSSLAAALEPLMIVFLGVVVGFIVVSMFLPLVEIIDQLSQ